MGVVQERLALSRLRRRERLLGKGHLMQQTNEDDGGGDTYQQHRAGATQCPFQVAVHGLYRVFFRVAARGALFCSAYSVKHTWLQSRLTALVV